MSTTPIVTRISDYFNPFDGTSHQANGNASDPSFTGDGRFVLFKSDADNIVWESYFDRGEPQPMDDLFLHVLDGGYNVPLTWGLPDVKVSTNLLYAPSVVAGAISPQPQFVPGGNGYVLVAIATDSQGADRNFAGGPDEPRVSDGSMDIGFITPLLFGNLGPQGVYTSVQMAGRDLFMVGNGERVTGVMAFSGDGYHLAYVADDGYELRMSDADSNRGSLQPSRLELRAADGAIAHVSASQDGRYIAFDSSATLFDLNGDQTYEVRFSDTDSYSNVFVYDRIAKTLSKVTQDSNLSAAATQGGYVGSFVPDPQGTGVPQLSVVSIAHPATGAPLPNSQAMLFTLSGGGWKGEIVSVTAAGVPAGGVIGSVSATAAAPAGTPWVGFTSYSQDLPDAPHWGQPITPPAQAWVGALGMDPVLVSFGDASSGYGGANADITDLALSPMGYHPADARMLAGQTGTFHLAAYTTAATNLAGGLATQGGPVGVYLSTYTQPAPVVAQPLLLDYTPGQGFNLAGELTGVDIDLPADRLREDDNQGTGYEGTLSGRLGQRYTPDSPVTLVSGLRGTVVLGSGDDVVTAPLEAPAFPGGNPQAFLQADVDGGAGADVVQAPAGSFLYIEGRLSGIETLRFDQAATSEMFAHAQFVPSVTQFPVSTIVGSRALDTVHVSVDVSAAPQVMDLSGLNVVGIEALDTIQVRGDGGLPLTVVAPAGMAVSAQATARIDFTGGDQNDSVYAGSAADVLRGGLGRDWFSPGLGADLVDGGDDRDTVTYETSGAAVQVDLTSTLPMAGGDAQGDLLLNIEDVWGSPLGDQLRGGAGPNQLVGGNGDDQLDGRGGDDFLSGGIGNDELTGGAGNDLIVGNNDNAPTDEDTAVFSGARSDYAVTQPVGAIYTGLVQVVDQRPGSPDGTDGLVQIDRYRFSDGTYTLAQLLAPQPTSVALSSATAPSVPEGTSIGTGGVLSFQVTRSGDLSGSTTVTLRVEGGDSPAASGDDVSLVRTAAGSLGAGFGDWALTFGPGQSALTVEVVPQADPFVEPTESVRLTLLSVTGGQLDPSGVLSAQGLILNDDLPPPVFRLSVLENVTPEGTAAGSGGTIAFGIERVSGGAADAATVTVSVGPGTGSDPASADDLVGGFGTLTVDIPQGENLTQFSLQTRPDAQYENDETLSVVLQASSVGTVDATPVGALIYNDDLPPPVFRLRVLENVTPEGTAAGSGGTITFGIERVSGGAADAATVTVSVGPGTGSDPALADDLVGGFGTLTVDIPQGENLTQFSLQTRPDAQYENDETLSVVLQASSVGTVDATPVGALIFNDDVSPSLTPPRLAAAANVAEGQPWALTITPQPAGIDTSAMQFRIDWGDGSAVQTLSGTALAAQGGVVTHIFADDPDGPVNRGAQTVSVQVTDPASQQVVGNNASVDVVDVAPVMTGFFGFPSPFIEHDTVTALIQGMLTDVVGDPVQELLIEWGDGPPQAPPLRGPATHSWTGLGHHPVAAFVVNDDGTFEVARTEVAITATAGGAAPNGTPAQWAAAWTDSLMSFSHKANADNPSENWSPVTLSAVNSGVLAGGDVFGGLLGVSGQSARTSSVRQEIDGTEALRIQLAGGERADSLIIDLARLFTDDAPGLREAGQVLLYDGSTLVGGAALRAENANGRLHVELLNQPLFDSVIFRAGTLDENAGGVFRPGGLVDGEGGYVPATPSLGSDFLIESVQFLDLPDVLLTGVPAGAGG